MKPKEVMDVLRISRKRTLTTKISGKERKEKVRKLLYDLAHFRNILIILIRKYKELYGDWLLNQSILYGLLSSRGYSGKYTQEFEKAMRNIEKDKDLCRLLKALKAQKQKIGNPHFVQSVIRQVIKDFGNFFKADKEFKKNPSKFRGKPNPPKPKKLRYLMNFSAEGNANTFEREE
ncbi:MAG TPA: transposase, partial [Aquifex aeolicus]|nr:transposase [Aquifex aeolicus]